MLVIGIMGFAADRKTIAIPTAAFLIVVQCIFKVSLGPTTYVIVGETSSSRIRAQTIVLGRAVYVCCGIVVQQINPRMLNNNSDSWNWGSKTGMFYFGLCFFWVIWIWMFLPETKNRTFADIDYLFQKKVNARHFATTETNCKSYPLVVYSCEMNLADLHVTQCSNSPSQTPRQPSSRSKLKTLGLRPRLGRSTMRNAHSK